MRPVQVLAVFQRDGAGGNPLGFVADSVGLGDASMQQIAAELGFSETVFLDWRPDEDPVVRIFTPAVELPFAGHPLVGTAWALNAMGPGAGRIRCGLGVVEVVGGPDRYGFSIGWEALGSAFPADPDLGAECGIPRGETWRVERPGDVIVVFAAAAAAVDHSPDLDAVAEHCDGLYHVAEEGEQVVARFFAPRLGVAEDPATGSAAAALAVIKRRQGLAAGRRVVDQGDHVGTPSRIELSWDAAAVAIGGGVARTGVEMVEP